MSLLTSLLLLGPLLYIYTYDSLLTLSFLIHNIQSYLFNLLHYNNTIVIYNNFTKMIIFKTKVLIK